MTKSFAESSLKAIDIFKNLVRTPLQNLLGGEVFSVEDEAQAGSPVARVLDQSASSDVVLRYQTKSAVFLAASRIFYAEHQQCKKFALSLTLRNSIKQSFEKTELNKLRTAIDLFHSGIPVVVPRYLCFARVYSLEGISHLHDLLAVETIPLIDHVFDSTGMNLPALRRRMEVEKSKEILLEKNLKQLAGLRSTDEGNTFLFMNKPYLDMYCLPYLYLKA